MILWSAIFIALAAWLLHNAYYNEPVKTPLWALSTFIVLTLAFNAIGANPLGYD